MPKLELHNHNPKSTIQKIVIELTKNANHTVLYEDSENNKTRKISTTTFLQHYLETFHHPIFKEAPAKFQNEQFLYTIQTPEAFKKMFRTIYLTLIFHAPEHHCVHIKSSNAFQKPYEMKPLGYTLSYKRPPETFINTNQLKILASNFLNSPDYQFYQGLYFDTAISIENLPEHQTYENLVDDSIPIDTLSEPIYLRYISDYVGHGAFAVRDIAKGEIVTFYAGEILQETQAENSFYRFSFTEYFPGMTLDSKDIGNLARFINHGENGEEIDADILKKHPIATANLSICYENYCGVEIICLKAKRDIEKDEQFLYDYGGNYWKDNDPIFFNQQGIAVNKKGRKSLRYIKISRSTLRQMVVCQVSSAEKKLLFKPTLILTVLLALAYFINHLI